MAYEFLNTTTYSNQLEEQEDLLRYLMDNENPDENTSQFEDVDTDLIQIIEQENDPAVDDQIEAEEVDIAEQDQEYDYSDDDTNTDIELLDFLFSEKKGSSEGAGTMVSAKNFISSDSKIDLGWLKKKSNAVKFGSLDSKLGKYLTTLPEDIREGLIATSGNDQTHAKNSKHYQDKAIDLRFNQKAYDYIANDPVAKELGINMLDPNHGTAKHIHLETKQYGGKTKYNFGGKTLFADTPETLRRGLNNPAYDKAILNLSGINTIRGLDNNQPVAVTDGSKYKVLKGPNDTSKFNGVVYEQILK